MAVAYVPLARLSHQSLNATTASLPVWVTAPGAVGGFVVAWRKPGNPVGWLLLAATAVSMLTDDAAYYAVADYRLHHGGLPLGWVALLAQPGGLLGLVLFGLVFLLFPRRQAAVITVGAIIGHHPQVDSSGQLFLISGDDPAAHSWNEALTAIFLLVAVCLVASLAGQVASWRHSSGERRQQLKWLAAGTAALVTGIAIDTVPGTAPIGTALFPAGLIALSLYGGGGAEVPAVRHRPGRIPDAGVRDRHRPAGRGVRRDRAAGHPGAPDPQRGGGRGGDPGRGGDVQPAAPPGAEHRGPAVNRARYDADQIIAGFASRLRGTVDLDAVRADLASSVQQTLEPAHVSVWIRAGAQQGDMNSPV